MIMLEYSCSETSNVTLKQTTGNVRWNQLDFQFWLRCPLVAGHSIAPQLRSEWTLWLQMVHLSSVRKHWRIFRPAETTSNICTFRRLRTEGPPPPLGNQPNISQASFKEWGEEREEEEPERRRQLDRRDSWREWSAGRVQMFDL